MSVDPKFLCLKNTATCSSVSKMKFYFMQNLIFNERFQETFRRHGNPETKSKIASIFFEIVELGSTFNPIFSLGSHE